MESKHSRYLAVAALGGLLVAGIVYTHAQQPAKLQPVKQARPSIGKALQGMRQQVAEGNEPEAREYYLGRLVNGVRVDGLAQQIGFPFKDPVETTTVADLLGYLKYPELTALDLHVLTSEELMAKAALGEILATRFFAPKITDVTDEAAPPPVPAGGFGWRKLVRLKARPGSTADTNNVEFAWFLQNTTETDVAADPYDPKRRVSKFNQVILTRKGAPAAGQSSGWFLTFGPIVKAKANSNVPELNAGQFVVEGNLNFGLSATFDEPRVPETNTDPKTYFVPAACAVCHGSLTKPKINYLDTDHWFDRVTPSYGIAPAEGTQFQQEDFTAVADSPHGVIYDGGKDRTTPQFKAAFEVIRKLNTEIQKQNEGAGGPPFQRRAVEKWLLLHTDTNDHIPPYKRGFGTAPWQEDKVEHRKLIYYFNRYCYRCHSSVRFHVMDREGVLGKLDTMPDRLVERQNPLRWMPQDRIFPGLLPNPQDPPEGQPLPGIPSGQLDEFLKLLDGLGQEP